MQMSIIIPVYNAAEKLPNLMDTVIPQLLSDDEVILIDDGSRDNSLSLCQRLASDDQRIRVICQANAGPGAARNAGLQLAKGDLIVFLDSDDLLLPGALDRFRKAMAVADLAIARFRLQTPSSSRDRGLIDQEITIDQATFMAALAKRPGSFYYGVLWNKCYRRRIIEENKLLFDQTMRWGEDSDFNLRYYAHVSKVSLVAEPAYCYIRSKDGVTFKTSFNLRRAFLTKRQLYRQLRTLYRKTGYWTQHRMRLWQYWLQITLFD